MYLSSMAISQKTIRILVALLISVSFIAAGYYFSSDLRATIANATSTEELLKAYAAKDSDSDGLPDWQESLYGTDAQNPHSVDEKLTDKEAVDQGKVEPKFKSETAPPEKVTASDIPGNLPAEDSLTERFSKQFFKKFMMSSYAGTAPSSEEVQVFVTSIIADLDSQLAPIPSFSEKDIRFSESNSEDLIRYIIGIENQYAINTQNLDTSKDEISYLYEVLIENKYDSLPKIQALGKAYGKIAEGMKTIAVPKEIVSGHLELMNATLGLSASIEDMAAFREDPVRTLLGIQRYQSARIQYIESLKSLDTYLTPYTDLLSDTDQGGSFKKLLNAARLAPVSGLP